MFSFSAMRSGVPSRVWVLVLALGPGVVSGATLALRCAPALADAGTQPPQPSLAALLQERRASVDPAVAELSALLRELRARPASDAGADALSQAERSLATLEQLVKQHADAPTITRHKQLVWAALLLADRLVARAAAQAALSRAEAAVHDAQAQAQAAKLARERAEAALAHGTEQHAP